MRQRLNHAPGFTLIELLVVLVILGSLIGLAVLSVGIAGPGRELRNEAERLAGMIAVLAEEAVLDNQEYGLLLSRESYQVLRYDTGKQGWVAWAGKPYQLPGWAEMTVELEGTVLELPLADETTNQVLVAPHLLLLSSGEISPFRLRLAERRADGLLLHLSSDGFQLPKVEIQPMVGSSR